jgi:TolB-like protein
MSKQIPHIFFGIIKKKLYSLIIMVAFLCIIAVPLSSTFAASNLEEGIKELAQQISNSMTKTGKKKIAVVEFSDLDGMVTAFGQHLAEELITELFLISPGQFEVVERRQLMKVLSEQRLTMSGLLDAKAMESVGKLLGIEAVVTGSMTDLESSIKINARMIGIETARVFAVARTSIPKIDIVAKLMAKKVNTTQPSPQTIPKTSAQLSSSSVYTNKNSKIFHRYDCPELNTEGLVEFISTISAIKAGNMACRNCNPPSQVTERSESEQGNTTTSAPVNQEAKVLAKKMFKDQAASLAEKSKRRGSNRTKDYIKEYNLMVKDIKDILKSDLFIQNLKELTFNDYYVSACSVEIMARIIEDYLTSFVPLYAFKNSISTLDALTERRYNNDGTRTLIGVYNILLRSIKFELQNDQSIQEMKELKFTENVDITAGRLSRMTKQLALLLAEYKT